MAMDPSRAWLRTWLRLEPPQPPPKPPRELPDARISRAAGGASWFPQGSLPARALKWFLTMKADAVSTLEARLLTQLVTPPEVVHSG